MLTKTQYRISCKNCNELFYPNPSRPKHVFCSRKCRDIDSYWKRKGHPRRPKWSPIPCKNCGVLVFDRKRDTHVSCSIKCAAAIVYKRNYIKAEEAGLKKNCQECGTEFIARGFNHVNCSEQCRSRAWKKANPFADREKRSRARQKRELARGVVKPEKAVCKQCGESFEYMRRGRYRIYCSPKCNLRNWYGRHKKK